MRITPPKKQPPPTYPKDKSDAALTMLVCIVGFLTLIALSWLLSLPHRPAKVATTMEDSRSRDVTIQKNLEEMRGKPE